MAGKPLGGGDVMTEDTALNVINQTLNQGITKR